MFKAVKVFCGHVSRKKLGNFRLFLFRHLVCFVLQLVLGLRRSCLEIFHSEKWGARPPHYFHIICSLFNVLSLSSFKEFCFCDVLRLFLLFRPVGNLVTLTQKSPKFLSKYQNQNFQRQIKGLAIKCCQDSLILIKVLFMRFYLVCSKVPRSTEITWKIKIQFTNKITKESLWKPSLWSKNSFKIPNQFKNWNQICNQHEIYYFWVHFGKILWESPFGHRGHCAM